MKLRIGWLLCLFTTYAVPALAQTKPAPAKPIAPASAPAAGGGYSGLGAESVSPELVAKHAAPPLDSKLSDRIRTLFDIAPAAGGVVTSKGDRMVFTSRVTGADQVWRQDGPMKLAIQLTAGEHRTRPVGITPDDKTLFISRDIGGQENPGLYMMSIEGGPLTVIQHTPKVQTVFQYVTDDGKTLYYRANDIDPKAYAIYRYDLASQKRELAFGEPGLWDIVDHKPDSWLLEKSLGSNQKEIYTYELASKKLTPVIGQGEVEEYAARFGAKPGQVLLLTNKLGDYRRLYSFENGALAPVSPETKYDIERFTIDQARQRIYWALNIEGFIKLVVFDARTYKPLKLPKLDDKETTELTGELSRNGALSRNGRFVQVELKGATMPTQIATVDWQTHRATTWRTQVIPELDPSSFAPTTIEYYPARDGTKIPMIVRRPTSCKSDPCPVVVNFHGGPEVQAQPELSTRAQAFVDAGFIYVEPNVRGSAGYGKTWLHADNGPLRLKVITDIEDAGKFIRANWGKDGRAPKIGVVGGSYGGYSVLIAMTMFAGTYDAGVSVVGISNLMTFLVNTAPYRRILRISEYGDPVKDKEALIQLSPLTHINKIKSPLLIIQGVNDPRVPVGESLQIYRELERRKIPTGLILFGDEGHGTAKRDNSVLSLGHTIAFLEKHLLAR